MSEARIKPAVLQIDCHPYAQRTAMREKARANGIHVTSWFPLGGAMKGTVDNWDDYDVVFIGCPVWWWTTPMIIHTFCESYDFQGKTVVPFCTYASTCRDETLAEIVSSTPDADHLTGEGLTSGRITPSTIQTWIDLINQEWTNNNSNPDNGDTAMSRVVNLWECGNIPTVTQNVSNSDGPDFIPNMEVFTVADDVTPKGAVIICPGGTTAISPMRQDASADGGAQEIYDMNGRKLASLPDTTHGVYIVKDANGSRKLLK